jgi:aspartate/methionine/tyrosine aminotransferase
MHPKLFKLEDIFEDYEQEPNMNVLGASDAASFTLKELLKLSSTELNLSENLGYHDVKGEQQLRQAVADSYPKASLTPANVLITSGASEAILLTLHTLLSPGDRALVCEPAYQALPEMAKAAGAQVIPYQYREEHDFEPDLDFVRRELQRSTVPKVLVLNTPHNPTGRVLNPEVLNELLGMAKAVGTRVVCDEVFSGILITASAVVPSVAELSAEAVVINCLSKVYGLAGLRIGWVVGPEEIIKKCKRLRYYTTLAPPNLVQPLATAALRSRDLIFERTQGIVDENYSYALQWLADHEEFLDWIVPEAGMVMLIKLKLRVDTDRFARDLAVSRQVFLVPCITGFEMPEGYLRLGLGGATEKFRAGLAALGESLKEIKPSVSSSDAA